MKISTKGRYAIRVMIDLASQEKDKYVPLKEIVQRQGISQKYLEGIMGSLSKAGLVDSLHGKGGGYRLNRAPKEYSAIEILKSTEPSMAPVACLDDNAEPCDQAETCKTLPMWKELYKTVEDYLGAVTLEDLKDGNHNGIV